MRIRVLGASGGELRGHGSTCFLVDGRLALDAGALTSRLDLAELDRVDHVLLTHAHLDHVKDVPLLADLMVGRRRRPVTVHASKGATGTLRRSLFNGKLWPDFTRIPSARDPVVRLESFAFGVPFRIGPYGISAVKVRHPVESAGFVVRRGAAAFAISEHRHLDPGGFRRRRHAMGPHVAVRDLDPILVDHGNSPRSAAVSRRPRAKSRSGSG